MSTGSNDIRFIDVVKALESIEATTQRTVMAKLLSSLLKKTPPPNVIDKVVYFILGQLRLIGKVWSSVLLRSLPSEP